MTITNKPILTAKGSGWSELELYDDRIRIKRPHTIKGDRDIYISQISSMEFRKTGLLWNVGYIKFSFMGGSEGNYLSGIMSADQNTVNFNSQHQEEFLAIKEALDRKIAPRDNKQPVSNISDLEKLAELRDKGIITPAEFDAKKKQILGL
jgi:hypothetical protein